MAEPATIAEAIEESAKGPLKVSGDAGSVERHPLPDQIAADRYVAEKAAQAEGKIGIRIFKIVSPGAV